MSERKQSNSNIKLTPSQKEQIQNLQSIYNQAEGLVKEVEDFIGEAGIPALNEMRYAGYHLAHSILVEDCRFCDSQITSAINHCKRACYEASEAGIVVALLKFSEFREDYKSVVVSEVVPEWQKIQKDFEKSQRDINEGRVRGEEDRTTDYIARMDVFKLVTDHCESLNCARDDLNAKIDADTKSGRRFIITSLLAGLAILVTLILGILGFFKNKPENPAPVQAPAEQSATK